MTGIYSKGTNINSSSDTNNILSLFIEEGKDYKSKCEILNIGFSIVDITTGKIFLHRIVSNNNDKNIGLDEICKILSFFFSNEIILNYELREYNINFIKNYCELYKYNIIENKYKKNLTT